jgi:hypothetical protein
MIATAPLSTPHRDPTARLAIARADGHAPPRPLMISLAEIVAVCYVADWLTSPLGRSVVAQAARASGRRE